MATSARIWPAVSAAAVHFLDACVCCISSDTQCFFNVTLPPDDGKIWAGLLKDVYGELWGRLLGAMKTAFANGTAYTDSPSMAHEMFQFTTRWTHQTNRYTVVPTGVGMAAAAAKIVTKYGPGEAAVSAKYTKVAGADISGFSLALAREFLDLDIGVLSALCDVHSECVGFTNTGKLLTNVAAGARKPAPVVDLYVAKKQKKL